MTSTEHDATAGGPWNVEVDTPVGPLRVVVSPTAVVGLYHRDHEPPPSRDRLGSSYTGETVPPEAAVLLLQAGTELEEYFAGLRRRFEVPLQLGGTAFQSRVWAALRAIPYGERRTYRDIAEQLGNPRMGRAIGAAVRANPVSIIVPGHRVVGTTGAVIGYAAGRATKTTLLELEAGYASAAHARH